ncbi:TetR/AcrR family transcriptional regulator [Patulibacter minatonensis]|uniref:TetR/AcrR family transcriptional regulator n=1 Tax=Patulibacter minatonensis TaxID=298163 RepID=UPI00047E20F8|nr:TetR/AcrR family transcriptional regulator [Patulibacter minatonensis]
MPSEPTTARGRATRERIVLAAAGLVAERGVAGMSLDDVCAQAPASKSQLYHYFDGRDDLQQAVAETTCGTVMDVQADVLGGFDTLDGAERYLDALVALQEQRGARGGCPIGSLAGQLAEHHEGSRLALADGFDRWETGFRVGLQAMADRGDLRAGTEVATVATQVLAAVQGGLLLTQVRRDARQVRIAMDGALAQITAARRHAGRS